MSEPAAALLDCGHYVELRDSAARYLSEQQARGIDLGRMSCGRHLRRRSARVIDLRGRDSASG